MKRRIYSTLFCLILSVVARAELVTFNLQSDSSVYSILDEQATGSVTNAGVIATLSASEGVMNRTTSGFGINGPGSDDTDALNSNQWIDVVFDQLVVFSNLNVSSWGASSAGEVQLGTNHVFQGSINGTGDTAYHFSVIAGEPVRIFASDETSSNNGFSVEHFTVSIPEPNVMAFFSFVGLGFVAIRRVML